MAKFVRVCDYGEACLGGSNTREQCAKGHHGPLCDLCDDDYHGGRGKPCIQCEGSAAVTIGLPIALFVLAMVVMVAAIYKYKTAAIKSVMKLAETASSGSISDAATEGLQRSKTSLSESRSKLKRFLAPVVGFFAAFGVKLRILISLVQGEHLNRL